MADEELRLRMSVTDDASAKIDGVADKADQVEKSDPTVKVSAKDDASDDLLDVTELADKFDARTAEAKLKVEQKEAKADLRKFERDLKDVDDKETEAKVLADIATAEKRLATIDNELDKLDGRKAEVEVEVEDPPNLDRQGESIGDQIGVGTIKGIAGAGIATAFASELQQGFERLQFKEKVRQQFDLTAADAERLGKEAGQLYADGWADSKGEIFQSLGQIQQQLVETGVVGEAETKRIAEGAIGISEVFGADVNETIRAVGQLLKNGLAPDAESALDVIVGGLQDGADQAGDFFDVIDEYSQHFDAMGLSAKDMTDIITTGFQLGQRDADKLADAVKEMRIRTVEDGDEISAAYASLRLNADDYRQAILSGGPAARQAFGDIIGALRNVSDPVEQNRLAIQLIGTQYEDLGPTALEALDSITDGTVRVTGATEELTSAVKDAEPEFEKLKRQISDSLNVAAEEGAKKINEFVDALDGDEIETSRENVERYAEQLREFGLTEDEVTAQTAALNEKVDEFGKSVKEATIAALSGSPAADEMARSFDDVGGSADDATDDVVDLRAAFADLRDEMSNETAYLDIQDGFDAVIAKSGEARDAIDSDSADAEAALRDQARAQIALKNDVIDYAAEIENLPPEKVSNILALIDQGKLDEARMAIDNLPKTKYIDVITRYTDQRNGSGPVDGPGSNTQNQASRAAPAVFAPSAGRPAARASAQIPPVNVVFTGNFYGTQLPDETMDQVTAHVQRSIVRDQ